MGRKKLPAVKEDLTCNLIPMVDIMFLLLLFFILGADMTQRESEDLILPQADRIQEYEQNAQPPTTTVNIHHLAEDRNFSCALDAADRVCRDDTHWVLTVRKIDYTWETIEAQLVAEAAENMETEIDPLAGVALSARVLAIRADENAPFGYVQRLIEMAGKAKIYKVECTAAKPPAE